MYALLEKEGVRKREMLCVFMREKWIERESVCVFEDVCVCER